MPVHAQILPADTPAASAPVEIPDDLSPEMVDGMLSRLTDSQIREVLRGELVRRAEENDTEQTSDQTLIKIEERLTNLFTTISTRLKRWSNHIINIGDRREQFLNRMSIAKGGFFGMLMASVILVFIGILAAYVVSFITKGWRNWLLTTGSAEYWDRVLRTLAMGLVECMPIVAFIAATRGIAPALIDWLGPLNGMVWIYSTGIWTGWLFIILVRRGFAPLYPQLRIATLDDQSALRVYTLLRKITIAGVAGWIIAGLSPSLGYGFPPALIIVALTGTLIAWFSIYEVLKHMSLIRAKVLVNDGEVPSRSLIHFAAKGLPFILCIYIAAAWAYWLLLWLEKGQHQLAGPIGTILVMLTIPIFDRLGAELSGIILRGESEMTERLRSVLRGAWHTLIFIIALFVIAELWGLNLFNLTKGAEAPAWAELGFDIVITLLIGQLIWRLVLATLHTEKRIASGGEDGDADEAAGNTRLATLTPIFRNMILFFLVIVISMIVLSAVGVDIGPLIASAGIIGIAVGFGAQTLVRDVFSGVFFLIDDAFRIGEYIELDEGHMGEVENISVRSLQLRNHRGPIITIPFGELKQITNHSRDWVIFKMAFRLEPETDPQQVKKVVKKVGQEFMEHPDHGPKFIEPLKSQGVHSIDDDSALVVRVKFKCKPRTQYVLRREVYHRLRVVFAENNIHFARRKVEVVGADGAPIEDPSKIALPDEVLEAASGSKPKTNPGNEM